MKPTEAMSPDQLTTHEAFLRRLARALVSDGPDADDLVQEAYAAALERPPEAPGSLRAWMAGVVRNKARVAGRLDWVDELPTIVEELCDRWRLAIGRCYDGGTEFAFIEIAVGPANHTAAIDQCLHFCRYIGKVGRGAEDDRVGSGHFFNTLIEHIVLDHATAIFFLDAHEACFTTLQITAGQLHELGLCSGFFKRFEHRLEQQFGISVFPRTSAKRHDFHNEIHLVMSCV